MKVTLPWPHRDLSPNARVHRFALAKRKKRYRRDCWAACLAAGIRRLEARRLQVRITFRPPSRRADRDNMVAAVKSGLDGVADALGVDDRRWEHSFAFGEPVKGGAVDLDIAILEGRPE